MNSLHSFQGKYSAMFQEQDVLIIIFVFKDIV